MSSVHHSSPIRYQLTAALNSRFTQNQNSDSIAGAGVVDLPPPPPVPANGIPSAISASTTALGCDFSRVCNTTTCPSAALDSDNERVPGCTCTSASTASTTWTTNEWSHFKWGKFEKVWITGQDEWWIATKIGQ